MAELILLGILIYIVVQQNKEKKQKEDNQEESEVNDSERLYMDALKDINELIRIEYPLSHWSWYDTNVAYRLLNNQEIGIKLKLHDNRQIIIHAIVENNKVQHFRYPEVQNDEVTNSDTSISLPEGSKKPLSDADPDGEALQFIENNIKELLQISEQANNKKEPSIFYSTKNLHKDALPYLIKHLLENKYCSSASIANGGIDIVFEDVSEECYTNEEINNEKEANEGSIHILSQYSCDNEDEDYEDAEPVGNYE